MVTVPYVQDVWQSYISDSYALFKCKLFPIIFSQNGNRYTFKIADKYMGGGGNATAKL